MENSKIEWTDHTFNPWEGCTKVSPGCLHCYAETRNARWGGGTAPNWGKGAPRRRTSLANWLKPRQWHKAASAAIEEAMHDFAADTYVAPPRPRVFCASLADWLDDEVPREWQSDLLRLIEATPTLDWLLLTKRPENWEGVMTNAVLDDVEMAHDWVNGRPPANVWIGTTVEDQTRADERIPELLKIPAKVRFLSCEPLLRPVNLEREFRDGGIHWLIAGGESGTGARPMHPDWARSLRDQCADADVPFLFKQWGEWAAEEPFYAEEDDHDPDPDGCIVLEPTGCQVAEINDRYEYQPAPGSWLMRRTGKTKSGRLLDGIEHTAFPTVH
jgi:protein gp37